MIKKTKFTLLVLTFITTGTLAQNKETPLTSILRKYSGKWPKTVTFSQTTTIYAPNGERKQTWYEAGSFPDYFRIDFNREKGSSVLINKDKEHYFKEGKLVRTGPNTNPLILITNGMYFLPKDTVVKKLLNLGIDQSKFHRYNWKGRQVLVVGTTTTDTTKAQIWFDEKELYLVRFIQPDGKDTMDVRFDKHRKIGSSWHEMAIDVYQNGKLIQKEEYFDFKTNVALDEAIFDPEKFGTVHWLDK